MEKRVRTGWMAGGGRQERSVTERFRREQKPWLSVPITKRQEVEATELKMLRRAPEVTRRDKINKPIRGTTRAPVWGQDEAEVAEACQKKG